VGAAIGWGALAASSLVIGALVGLARPWPRKWVGLVLGFGAGALISAVSFELFEEGIALAGALPVAIGLAVGAMAYYLAAGRVAAMGGGAALALGAFLDGIPEQLVLGIGLAGGETVSAGLLAAIFVSNLPEAVGGATDMTRQGHAPRMVIRNWIGIATCCALATPLG
jgi:ZIP family zinc transporter